MSSKFTSHLQQLQNDRDVYWEDVIDKSADFDLKEKVAIVTGGSRGIGRATVDVLLQKGVTVVSISRSDANEQNSHPNLHHKSCDVRHVARVQEIVNETVAEFGSLDILINCAAYAFITPLQEESEELFDKIMDINFKGVRNFIVAATEHLKKSKGSIVSLGSIWGLPGTNLAGDATYSAGDAAIIKYSEVAATELPEIRINTVSPALVDTGLNDDMSEEAKTAFAKQYKDRDTLLQPTEIAQVVEFLVSNNITQKNIIIDAGYTERH